MGFLMGFTFVFIGAFCVPYGSATEARELRVAEMSLSDLKNLEQQATNPPFSTVKSFEEIIDEARRGVGEPADTESFERQRSLERILASLIPQVKFMTSSSLLRIHHDDYGRFLNPELLIEAALLSFDSYAIFFGLHLARYRGLLTMGLIRQFVRQLDRGRRGNLSFQLYLTVQRSPLNRFGSLFTTWRTYGRIRDGYSQPGAYEAPFALALEFPEGLNYVKAVARSWDREKARDAQNVLQQTVTMNDRE